jgi:hypothetical protein
VTGMTRLPGGESAWSDGMYKRLMFLVVAAAAFALAACSPLVSSGSQGEILVYLGGDASSRALSDPPFTELPVFSSITIRVSGPGMEPVEFNVDVNQSSFATMVPGGSDRVVEVYAPVDWDATATAYPGNVSLMPTLVKAYGATATVDVVPGQRVTAVLRLEVAETKILLPNVIDTEPEGSNAGFIGYADSLFAVPSQLFDLKDILTNSVSLVSDSDIDYDRYGNLYFSSDGTIYRRSTLDANSLIPATQVTTSEVISNISMDRKSNRLFFINSGLHYLELSDSLQYTVILPGTYETDGYPLALDNSENLYCLVTLTSNDHYLAKLHIDGTTSTLVASVSLSDLGLVGLTVRDMTVKDGKLYLLAGENWQGSTTHQHGKLVEIDPVTMTKTRELGWSADHPTDPATQLYGPQRFLALAQHKLIFADEGLVVIDEINTNVDRVVEVDLETWSISAIGLEDAVTFYYDYSLVG